MTTHSTHSGSELLAFPQLCRFLGEHSPQPMLAVEGPAQTVRYANPAFHRLLGSAHDRLIGRPFAEAVPEGMANGCAEMLERVYRTGRAETLAEQPHRLVDAPEANDSLPHWSYLAWAIIDPSGRAQEPAGVMVQVTDATATARFRRESVAMNAALVKSSVRLHELMEEAARLNGSLRQREAAEHEARLEAQAANESKEIFLATLSHELRGPLSAILGWVALLRRSPSKETMITAALDHGLQVIERCARAQLKLIEDVIDVARVASGKFELECRPCDLEGLVRATVDTVHPAAVAKGITLDLAVERDESSGAYEIVGDPARLSQALLNLLGNAVKFTPGHGRIWVRLARVTKPEGQAMRIVVADNGQGITAEFLPCVFDRFAQADARRARTLGGLGLGLSIVRQIADLHGGSVSAHSEGPGRGAQFLIELPQVASVRSAATAK